jgi:hypothetical protein
MPPHYKAKGLIVRSAFFIVGNVMHLSKHDCLYVTWFPEKNRLANISMSSDNPLKQTGRLKWPARFLYRYITN